MILRNVYYNFNKDVDGCIDVLFQIDNNFIHILFGEVQFFPSDYNIENYLLFNFRNHWLNQEVIEIFQINSLNKGWTTAIELKNNIIIAIIFHKSMAIDSIENIELYQNRKMFMENNFVNQKYFTILPNS